MDVEMTRGFMGKILNGAEVEKILLARAKPIAQTLRAITPVRTGGTAGSVTIESGHTNAKRDRRAVRIVQSGAAVPLNWRTRRRYMLRALGGR